VDLWKIGLDFQKDEASGFVSRTEIERKVRYLMDPSSSKALRERACELSAMATDAFNGSSKQNLDAFIDFLLE
jgi:hypothetical protein